MTRARNELQIAARKRYQALRRKQRDPRFKKVMGRFVAANLLTTNIDGIRPHEKPVPIDDALWAGMQELQAPVTDPVTGLLTAYLREPCGGNVIMLTEHYAPAATAALAA